MEFFRILDIETNEDAIKNLLNMRNLEGMSSQLFLLEKEANSDKSNIGSIWGEFTLCRYSIKGGVRFALTECPNALTWTITTGYPPVPEAVIVHLTINRIKISTEFSEEIEEFLNDHSDLIIQMFSACHSEA